MTVLYHHQVNGIQLRYFTGSAAQSTAESTLQCFLQIELSRVNLVLNLGIEEVVSYIGVICINESLDENGKHENSNQAKQDGP
jgi:hypothetical protein